MRSGQERRCKRKQCRVLEVKARYRDFMLARYGHSVIDQLEAQNKTKKQFTHQELKDLYEKYS